MLVFTLFPKKIIKGVISYFCMFLPGEEKVISTIVLDNGC